MTRLSRRSFGLAALSAPALLGLASAPARADGHAAARAPMLFQASLGKYKVTSLFDGLVPLGKDFFFGVDAAEIDAALGAAGIEGDALPAPINAFLLQSEDRNILIDAGFGAVDMFGPGFGRMFDGLAALGLSADDIDTVIVTHAHPDHIGGLMGADGPAFKNAQVLFPEGEVAFWGDEAIMSQAPEEAKGLFQMYQGVAAMYGDQIVPTAAGAEITPGIRLDLSPGHTPAHSIVHIDGGDQELIMLADTLHNVTLHTALPQIGFGFDSDTALAAESRIKLFDRVATDKILVAGSHIHFPGFGRILKDGDAYRYLPASWA
ncbi:MAG: MBL fold metallo-hydrolase [Pseudomonadota bacterium]